MKFSPHLTAIVITIVAVAIFLILRSALNFQFGLRTYWPVFLCIYLVVWYFAQMKAAGGNVQTPEEG